MVNKQEQIKKAELFRSLHQQQSILVLPNAWDVISAKIIEQAGFPAVATTSAGVSSVLGYPDGQHVTIEDNVELVRRMMEIICIPISVDIEAGYGVTSEEVVLSASKVMHAGGVGINLEDSTGDDSKPFYDITEQCEKFCSVREMAEREGIPLFINARCDIYMSSDESKSAKVAETIKRGNEYSQAGADCIFIPDLGDLDSEMLRLFVNEIDVPINYIVGEHSPSIDELEEIGVSRVTFGPRHMRLMLAFFRKMLIELKEKGSYDLMTQEALSYAEINEMLKRK